ncbi:AMP-binding protein [Phenylobacterium sp.]|uniref:AMP-binding protein n=1 Tax=Phenylobacterium sp. TaxID=1871053 RepID=UPI0035AE55C7
MARAEADKVYRESVEHPEAFWMAAAAAIDWDRAPTKAWNGEAWFADGKLNTCFNAVDRHVAAGAGERAALIWESPVTGSSRRFTFAELQAETARLAGVLAAEGVGVGDRVVIYMPMVPEAVIGMLACARLGAVHSVVFGGFAAAELAKRIDDAKPKMVLSASCGIEPQRLVAYKPLLDHALELSAHKVDRCLILQRPQLAAEMDPARDRDWSEALAGASPHACVPVGANDPLYVLYTSGTTGLPKGVVRDNGGHAVALAWSMRNIYGVEPGEVFWAASDIGWVVGHSYIVYGPLLHGCTTILYEGKPVGTPDAGAFWRIIRKEKVSVFFTAPTAIRAIRREDPDALYIKDGGVGDLRALFLAGERADPETVTWSQRNLDRPVIDHWWQTELGWPALAVCFGLGDADVRIGAAGRPTPGYRFAVLHEDHEVLPAGEMGDLVINLPLPPGCATTLWNDQAGYDRAYLSRHPGYYTAGDAGFIDDDGFVHVMSRIDDIINVAGHRLSTGGIEQIIAAHPAIAECAVVGAPDALKGQAPVALVVPKAGQQLAGAELSKELVQMVRDELGPVAAFKVVAVTEKLPKTRSGKILRNVIRSITAGEEPKIPPTIEDMQAVDLARDALQAIGWEVPESK